MRGAWAALLLVVAAACGESPRRPGPARAAPFVVDAAWMRRHGAGVVVVDLQRTAADYRRAHYPGARYLDVEQLRDGDRLLRDVASLCATLGRLGIDADTHVVAYDNRRGYNAGLFWYALHQLGHGEVSLLDGQLAAFGPGELASGDTRPVAPAKYVARRPPGGVVASDWVVRHLADHVFVDARIEAQYTGAMPREGIVPGHLPGAINLPWDRFLNPDGTYVDGARLAHVTSTVPRDRTLVLYCNSYQAAAFVQFHLARAGFTRILAFDGSIRLYQRDKRRPLVLGS